MLLRFVLLTVVNGVWKMNRASLSFMAVDRLKPHLFRFVFNVSDAMTAVGFENLFSTFSGSGIF